MKAETERTAKKPGLPPGTIVYVGKPKAEKVRVRFMDYDASQLTEGEVSDVEEFFSSRDGSTTTWVDVDGIHDVGMIEKIGKALGLHGLTLEDVAHARQRPKLEDYGEYAFVVLRIPHRAARSRKVKPEQLSIILTKDCVVTFQERRGDMLEPVRERIRSGRGRVRQAGADYLAYAIIDAVVDNCFDLLEEMGDRLDALHEDLLRDPKAETMGTIHGLRGEIVRMRKSLWPLREVVAALQRGETALIREETNVYLRDVYDHCVLVLETVETYRDIIAGMTDLYLSSVSNRMNEVMKVLTIIATIFIPLTFIAGIYGMNFKNMPELGVRWGYPATLGVMVAVGVVMLIYFRRKRWL